MDFLADRCKRQPLRRGCERRRQPFDRLKPGLTAQLKRLVMNWEDNLRARVIRHLQRLFGRTVSSDPGVVGADGHDGKIDRARRPQLAERSRQSRVSAKDHAIAWRFDEVAVESAPR